MPASHQVIKSSSHHSIIADPSRDNGVVFTQRNKRGSQHWEGLLAATANPPPPPPQQIYKENKNLLSALLAKRKHDHHLALCGKSFFLLPLDVENSSVTRGHNGVGESFCPHFIKLFFFFFSKVEFFANRVTTRGIFTEKKGFWRAEGKVIIRRGIETRVTTWWCSLAKGAQQSCFGATIPFVSL